MRDIFISLAALAVVLIGGKLLMSRRRSRSTPLHVPSADGTFTLRPPRRNAFLLGVSALVPAAVLGLLTFQAWESGGFGLVASTAATLVALGAAAYVFVSGGGSRLVVRETGLERVGVFRRRVVGWTSVAKIAFNPVQRWFFITASDGSHLWVPTDLAGIGSFASVALRRVRPVVFEGDGGAVREVLEELADAARQETRGA
jgi:hypothetical protein